MSSKPRKPRAWPRPPKFRLGHTLPEQQQGSVPHWAATNVILGAGNVREIVRRVRVTKQALIGALLAPSGLAITGNEFITFINVLIQQPIIVLLYEHTDDGFVYRKHFDYRKAQESRGSLALKALGRVGFVTFEPDEAGTVDSGSLFRVCDTKYLLRVFLLDTTAEDQPFYEVQNRRTASRRSSSASTVTQEYTRLCLGGLLEFDEQDSRAYGDAFISALNKKLSELLDRHRYTKDRFDNGSRRVRTLVRHGDSEKVKKFYVDRKREWIRQRQGLDLVYTHASYGARTLKLLGTNPRTQTHGGEFPNIFFTFSAYDRELPRATRGDAGIASFAGYAHSISFVISDTQRKDILEYFSWMGRIGENYYSTGLPIKNELYGEGWDFSSSPGYRSLAQDLDRKFWGLLKEDGGAGKVLEILCSSVGGGSTSMVDPVFYYGSSLYRMPFRRLGGLGRLNGLRRIYEGLSPEARERFSLEHINGPDHDELRNDCLRIVAFFYLSRMLGPVCSSQVDHYTKVHLYPLTVAGAIVGTVGKISFQPKVARPDDLPVPSFAWNQEFLYFTEVVSAVRNAVDAQYREFQIDKLALAVERALVKLIDDGRSTGTISTNATREFVDAINDESRCIARFCPYPAFRFVASTDDVPAHVSGMHRIAIGESLCLSFSREPSWDVFRTLVTHGSDVIVDEVGRALEARLNHRVSRVLEQHLFLLRATGFH
jgi:hypothetical protein